MARTETRRYRPAPRLSSLMAMLTATLILVLTVMLVYPALQRRWWEREEIAVPAAGAAPIPVTAEQAARYGVVSAARLTDEQGRLSDYLLITERQGYASAIRVQSTFSASADRLVNIRVLSQRETEYLGARIASERFAADFNFRRLPVKLWESAVRGSPVDGLSGSTVSAQAVVDAVNGGYDFLREYTAA